MGEGQTNVTETTAKITDENTVAEARAFLADDVEGG